MKKFLALLLCLVMAFAIVACDKEDVENDDKNESTKAKSSVSFYVNYNSVKIELGADAKPVITALGNPKSSQDMGNCGGQGTLTKYSYASVELYVLKNGSAETVDQITLLDDSTKTPENISIGATEAQVLEACGTGYATKNTTGITYTSGAKNLKFTLRDGSVTGIDYRLVTN